jgi:hypothetical protein
MQFPAIMGGVVTVVNLDGVAPGQLKLTGPVVADIYLGKITKWNAPEIAALNPGVKLPADDITVVHRADGSGTSFLFTDYLSKTNPEFKTKIGAGTAVKWAVGVGGKGNEGVAANVQRIKGSIGYVEWAYAKKNKMSHTQLKNKDGVFLQPDDDNFKAAAANADWAKTPGFGVVLTDQAGQGKLADHRRVVHPDAQSPGRRRQGQGSAEVLRLGLQERRRRRYRTGLRATAGIGCQAGAGCLESQPEGRFGQGDLVILTSRRPACTGGEGVSLRLPTGSRRLAYIQETII